jgi:hypothetical protein
MLSKMLEPKKIKSRSYEVLFLRNGGNQDVEAHEVNQVDFLTIKERLERGESVFITSKASQKVASPKHKKTRSMKTRLVTAFHFDPA